MIFLKNIHLRRGTKLLLQDVNLQIHPAERVGIVGENGCGKSSFLEMIRGELNADQGEIKIQENLVMAHVDQQTPTDQQAAIEYVLDGDSMLRQVQHALRQINHDSGDEVAAKWYEKMEQIDGYSAPSRAARLMHGLGFENESLTAPTASFSGGWRVRLNLARALMCPSDLLLLDEPTNHLDLDAVVWLEAWLKGYRGTILAISHDQEFLDAICTRILHIESVGIRSYPGNFSAFEKIRAERMAADRSTYQKQQRAIGHMQDYVRRFRAKASKAKQAQSRLKALERMQSVAPVHVSSPFHFNFLEIPAASSPLVKLTDVRFGYDDRKVLEGINISVSANHRIALVGHNGAGKSTLIKLLAGVINPSQGEIITAKGLKVGYFAQHQLEQLNPDFTPMQQLVDAFPDMKPQDLRNFVSGFGFRGARADQKVNVLSGGEKARLALALLIYGRPNLLLMDEPTNHLDLEMRHALAVAFQNYRGAVVLVSHDRHLIRTVTDELWLIHDGDVRPFEDDVDGYIKWTKEDRIRNTETVNEARSVEAGIAALSKKALRQQSAKQRQQLKPLTQEISKLEKKLEQAQAEIQSLEKALSDPATFESESTADLAIMMQTRSRLEKKIESMEIRWLEVSEQLENTHADLS
jgi:ATP-binding cassette subfamily F protein 3